MNVITFKKIIKLCEEYQKQNCLTPAEFVAENTTNEAEDVLFNFLNFQRHEQILRRIVEHFTRYNGIAIKLNMTRFMMLFYILIFVFDPEDKGGIEKIFIISNKITHASKVLLYYSNEENQILTARIACQFFENDYVLSHIIHPILNNQEHFENVFDYVAKYEHNLYRKECTIPIEMNVSKKPMKIPAVPMNTPAELDYFRSNPIPRTTYRPDLRVQRNLSQAYEKNQEKALELLEKARTMPDHGKPSSKDSEPEPKIHTFKRPKRIPLKQDVPIKANLTTIMREAALYAKEKESCIKEIEEILRGGVDTERIKSLEKGIREEEQRKQIEEVERKKLQCLLSHEEAVIAKCKLKTKNKIKYYEILEESEALKAQLLEWKRKKQEEYRIKIEKAQESNRNAKESEKKMIEEKQCTARLVQWESKMLLDKAMEEKEKELAKKIHIIQEIKAMHQVRKVDTTKEFDRTECPNLGLLCEMSIAELEERLMLMKMDEQRRLDEKREEISKKKEEKNKMIKDAKEFIEQNRSVRAKPEKKKMKILVESEDIILLRKKIEEAKKIREACAVCPCKPCPVILGHDPNK
ncbi:cilia- and flagella-associated protein 99-like [Coccinella septempunctata]|uniref:cilia- and flagella-associated protein 99-like n=1 Tax=Coccinella septempunctata TaxID=41139 RepID=UPI001D07D188|nr:cilia- and flagella-associated protein 99-like [Coccinella septempunctata]